MNQSATSRPLPPAIEASLPPTALAPMQNVTDRAFMEVIAHYGAPDYFVTEYFSVYPHSRLDPAILSSITDNSTGRPVFAQLLGNDPGDFVRMAEYLMQHPVAGIDLNLGCPAPKVYKRNAGGGLLRNLDLVYEVVTAMRAAIGGLFSVKCRLGFDSPDPFEPVVEMLAGVGIDFLTVHGRTVRQMYRGGVDYGRIGWAVQKMPCPVFANGNISSAEKGAAVLAETGCHGLMVGRAAIRNPWIFRQLREHLSGRAVFRPKLRDVREYVDRLYLAKADPAVPGLLRVNHLKRYLVFVAQGVDEAGEFLHRVRRVSSESELFLLADEFLLNSGNGDLPFAPEPFEHLVARPNQEQGCG